MLRYTSPVVLLCALTLSFIAEESYAYAKASTKCASNIDTGKSSTGPLREKYDRAHLYLMKSRMGASDIRFNDRNKRFQLSAIVGSLDVDENIQKKDKLEKLKEPLKYMGPLFFFGIQLSTIKTAIEIFTSQSIGKLSPVPFVSLLACGFTWATYGFMKKDKTIMVPNASAVVVAAVATTVFHSFDPAPSIPVYLIGAAVIALTSLLAAMKKSNAVGILGSASAILMMASPLATLSTVIAEKSTAALPLLPSVMSWANGLCWALYGIVITKDMNLIVPNSVGFFFGTVQLLLYAIYGLPPPIVP